MSEKTPRQDVAELSVALETCQRLGLPVQPIEQALAQVKAVYDFDVRIGEAIDLRNPNGMVAADRGTAIRTQLLEAGLRIVEDSEGADAAEANR